MVPQAVYSTTKWGLHGWSLNCYEVGCGLAAKTVKALLQFSACQLCSDLLMMREPAVCYGLKVHLPDCMPRRCAQVFTHTMSSLQQLLPWASDIHSHSQCMPQDAPCRVLQALRQSNVKVVLIAPGPIATTMTKVRSTSSWQ